MILTLTTIHTLVINRLYKLLKKMSHQMQTLAVGFISLLKRYYTQEVRNWLRRNAGTVVTAFQVGEPFGKNYVKAATIETAIHGW